MAKPSSPAPLDASMLGVPKGQAVPVMEDVAQEIDAPPKKIPPPVPPSAAAEEVRTTLTVRLPISTQERLRIMAFNTRREKQAIVDEALKRLMDEQGY